MCTHYSDPYAGSVPVLWTVLLLWSNDATVSIPDLAERLFNRTADSGWVVVFKAMIVTHELMAKGSEVSVGNEQL